MKILIVGARGFLGSRVKRALQRLPSASLSDGSSQAGADAQVDLNDPATFRAMDTFDVVINCANTFKARPDRAISHCQSKRMIFVETTSDPQTMQRIIAVKHGNGEPNTATVVLGMGVFPGLSNILAGSLYRLYAPQRMDVAVRVTLMSGAGSATCDLMAGMFDRDGIRSGPILPFVGASQRTLQVVLPEISMLRETLGIRAVGSYLAPSPGFLRSPMLLVSYTVPASGVAKILFSRLLAEACRIVRSRALREWKANLELIAVADRSDAGYRAASSLTTDDGMLAGGYAVAAAIACWTERGMPPPGFHFPDQLFEIDLIVRKMKELANGDLRLDLQSDFCRAK